MKLKIKRLTIAALALVLAAAAFAAADRYLIRHVEIVDVNAYASAVLPAAATEAAASSETAITETVADAVSATNTPSAEAEVVSDDWSYHSQTSDITITQVTEGSGANTITYFVADVLLKNGSQVQSAFADDKFGTNIIAATSDIAAANNAVFAINGDYYGFRQDGILIRNGVIYRDLPARIGLAFYSDGSMQVYDETSTDAQTMLDSGVVNTLSFGPALLDDGEIAAGLTSVEVDHNFGNHSIQGAQPRTALGMIALNHYVFVVVDGRSRGYSRGMTLTELAALFQRLGCTEAYNLDGGGSSTMVFMGRVVNQPCGKNGERGTSDILYISE
jgi:Exopolysaccharide biosynthesis protein related to N-acetylglucosamine-1-phosphodiester alpha-N-acetylglucosaminidase